MTSSKPSPSRQRCGTPARAGLGPYEPIRPALPPGPIDVVLTKIFFDPRQWALLLEWVTRPTAHTKHGDGGGMQKRRCDGASRMNEAERSLLLTTHSSPVRKTKDDVSWIAATIINQRAGGFQWRVARIFTGTHPAFVGLSIQPRKRGLP